MRAWNGSQVCSLVRKKVIHYFPLTFLIDHWTRRWRRRVLIVCFCCWCCCCSRPNKGERRTVSAKVNAGPVLLIERSGTVYPFHNNSWRRRPRPSSWLPDTSEYNANGHMFWRGLSIPLPSHRRSFVRSFGFGLTVLTLTKISLIGWPVIFCRHRNFVLISTTTTTKNFPQDRRRWLRFGSYFSFAFSLLTELLIGCRRRRRLAGPRR